MAKQWDEELGRMVYCDKVNSLEYIINKQLKLDLTEKDQGKYVEAPIMMRNEVHAVLDMHDNDVSSDRANRMMSQAIEPPSTATKKKAKVSSITPGTSTPFVNADVHSMSTPVVIVKPAAIMTPTVKPTIFLQAKNDGSKSIFYRVTTSGGFSVH
jgi:hypothetical protein